MWGQPAAGTVYRCEVDGVATFSETRCSGAALVAQETLEQPARAKDTGHREQCRRVLRFARQVADGRRVGVEQAAVERATKGVDPGLVGVVVRLYAVPMESLEQEGVAIEQECLKVSK